MVRHQDVPLDRETLDMLRTVCAAGQVRTAFNGESNARIEELLTAGFLVAVDPPASSSKGARQQRFYKPTLSARELSRELGESVP